MEGGRSGVRLCPGKATGLQGSWDQCSQPKEIRVSLRETRQGAKRRAGGASSSKPASPAVGTRTDVSMENRCSLGLNVGQGGGSWAGRKRRGGKSLIWEIECP